MVLSSLRFSSEKQGHKPGGARASPARARFFQYKIADPTRQIANFPRASARQKKSRLRRALNRARLLGCRVLFCLRDGGVRNWTSLCCNLSYQKFGGAKNQESAPREHQEPRAKETTAPVQCAPHAQLSHTEAISLTSPVTRTARVACVFLVRNGLF